MAVNALCAQVERQRECLSGTSQPSVERSPHTYGMGDSKLLTLATHAWECFYPSLVFYILQQKRLGDDDCRKENLVRLLMEKED